MSPEETNFRCLVDDARGVVAVLLSRLELARGPVPIVSRWVAHDGALVFEVRRNFTTGPELFQRLVVLREGDETYLVYLSWLA